MLVRTVTVKAKRGRRRYIAFDVPADLDMGGLIQKLPRGRFRVIQCAGGMAAVRCDAQETKDCIEAVTHAVPGAVPRRTSGTIKTLRDRYSVLRDNRPPRPRP